MPGPQDHEKAIALFYSKQCPHCRHFRPKYQAIASRHTADGIAAYEIEVGEDDSWTARFGVSSWPTVLLFRNGMPFGRIEGDVESDQLEATLRAAYGSAG